MSTKIFHQAIEHKIATILDHQAVFRKKTEAAGCIQTLEKALIRVCATGHWAAIICLADLLTIGSQELRTEAFVEIFFPDNEDDSLHKRAFLMFFYITYNSHT